MLSNNKKLPNILVIMVDQMTPFMLGAYGHSHVKTPNLDKLVKRGVRFDTAYTANPICVPARAAFMTGQYTSHISCHDNGDLFSSYIPTFAHYLTNQGYDTVLSGKMHFVGADQLHGFRTRLTTDVYPAGFDWSYDIPEKETRNAFDFYKQYQASNVGPGRTLELQFDEETHFRSLEYLRDSHQNANPFLLVTSFTSPHPPFVAPQKFWDMYKDIPIDMPHYPKNMEDTYSHVDRKLNSWHGTDHHDIRSAEHIRKIRRGYYALISYVDEKVGELIDALEEAGIRDNTAIIFTADHGDMLGEKGMIQKRSLYDWSSRIPMIIELPNVIAKGLIINTPVSIVDILPTLLDIAEVPTEQRMHYDGISLYEIVNGEVSEDREVFTEYHGEGVMEPCFMVRSGNYKYHYLGGKESRLFDIYSDPGEWNNLSGFEQYQSIESCLKAKIFEAFDPETIVPEMIERLNNKRIIKKAMHRNQTSWDYQPNFDASRQYVRANGVHDVLRSDRGKMN